MKKNVMMRLAAFLLVAVLVTTCGISGTYAKYVTSGSATDTARVAKWGVVLTVEADNLFSKEYDSDTEKTVISSNEQKVVAPGTKNDTGVTFKISGTPEVAFKLAASLTKTDGSAVEDIFLKANENNTTYPDYTTANTTDSFTLSENYYPVVFTLVHTYKEGGWPILDNNVTAGSDNKIGENYTATKVYTVVHDENAKTVTVTGTLTDINAVLELVSSKMSTVNPNYKLDDAFKLTWEWVFEHGTDATAKATYNAADTFLGNIAADASTYAKNSAGTSLTDGTDYNLDLNYSFSITVEQVN